MEERIYYSLLRSKAINLGVLFYTVGKPPILLFLKQWENRPEKADNDIDIPFMKTYLDGLKDELTEDTISHMMEKHVKELRFPDVASFTCPPDGDSRAIHGIVFHISLFFVFAISERREKHKYERTKE